MPAGQWARPVGLGVSHELYFRVQCIGCRWPFQCPKEQRGRQWCYACESTGPQLTVVR